MSTVIKVVATGMLAQQAHIEAIAHNMANANTPAYKTTRIEFQDREYVPQRTVIKESDTRPPTTIETWLGTGVSASSRTLFSQGSLIFTGQPTDVAIVGDGFFTLRLPDGRQAFTRNGAFSTDAKGVLVSVSGYPLDPPIQTKPGTILQLTDEGDVKLATPTGEVQGTAGAIQLASFVNPEGLQPLGKGLYLATDASGQPQLSTAGADGHGNLVAGAIEQSNVSVADELVNMIEAQRAYQVASKAVSALIEMLEESNRLGGAG